MKMHKRSTSLPVAFCVAMLMLPSACFSPPSSNLSSESQPCDDEPSIGEEKECLENKEENLQIRVNSNHIKIRKDERKILNFILDLSKQRSKEENTALKLELILLDRVKKSTKKYKRLMRSTNQEFMKLFNHFKSEYKPESRNITVTSHSAGQNLASRSVEDLARLKANLQKEMARHNRMSIEIRNLANGIHEQYRVHYDEYTWEVSHPYEDLERRGHKLPKLSIARPTKSLSRMIAHSSERDARLERLVLKIIDNIDVASQRAIKNSASSEVSKLTKDAMNMRSSAQFLDQINSVTKKAFDASNLSSLGLPYLTTQMEWLQEFLNMKSMCDDQDQVRWKQTGCKRYLSLYPNAQHLTGSGFDEYISYLGQFVRERGDSTLNTQMELLKSSRQQGGLQSAALIYDSLLGAVEGSKSE